MIHQSKIAAKANYQKDQWSASNMYRLPEYERDTSYQLLPMIRIDMTKDYCERSLTVGFNAQTMTASWVKTSKTYNNIKRTIIGHNTKQKMLGQKAKELTGWPSVVTLMGADINRLCQAAGPPLGRNYPHTVIPKYESCDGKDNAIITL